MVATEQEIIEKIEVFLKNEKFPSHHDLIEIKRGIMEIMDTIGRFEVVENNDDDDNGVQIARELIAQANIMFAVEKFLKSDAVKRLF
jgi:predicted transcriptional regulator